MSHKYAIGEILIFQHGRFEPERNGMECLVMEHRTQSINPDTMEPEQGTFYAIEFEDCARRSALESQLRRRDETPPTDASMRDVHRPNEVTA
ncbi:hypothetical protein [Paraburkholderia sp. C35]|uniref:hypothetical protein n=1 Tax=Paraburkholderia sp. C35 TaxID=2126993 RepID=UPI000D69D26E|nr:hypothetical protein [Paraburkholderia sp. C35]